MQSDPPKFENQKIVVVGGSSGIGYAVAQKALHAGAQVVIASRSDERLGTAAKQLGGRVQTEVVDASDELSVADFFRRVGHFDHLAITIKPPLPSGRFLENELGATIAAFDAKFWGSVADISRRTNLSESAKRKILGENAARLQRVV